MNTPAEPGMRTLSRPTGGQAFPSGTGTTAGLTKRDYFAAKTMQALCEGMETLDYHYIAGMAYEMADAMLLAAS